MNDGVLILCSSPRKNSFSSLIAETIKIKLNQSNIRNEIILLKSLTIRPCIGCNKCRNDDKDICVIDDDMQKIYPKIVEYKHIILASPIYWFSVNSIMKAFVDRLYGLHTEKTKILENKLFSIVLVYGDSDVIASGVSNAIRMYEDAFKYTKSKIIGVVHTVENEKHQIDIDLEKRIDGLINKIRTT